MGRQPTTLHRHPQGGHRSRARLGGAVTFRQEEQAALANVSVTAPGYTDSLVPGVTPIKAQHIIELQLRAQ